VPDGLDAFEYVWADLNAELARLRARPLPPPRFDPRDSSALYAYTFRTLSGPHCPHANAVPVESVVTGELLARLCPDCDQQLSAGYDRAEDCWPGAMF
jgi:hypothetical protein